jgi:hypothetical protein
MANIREHQTQNPLRRAASSVRHAIDKLTHRHHDEPSRSDTPQPLPRAASEPQRQARPRRTESDIPLDRIEGAYTPTQTSLKTSFRADGADRQRDQEFANGYADERWNDEDQFTNKSGDPRIGTHGRAYEPGEGGKKR